jgi:hypothetical protein
MWLILHLKTKACSCKGLVGRFKQQRWRIRIWIRKAWIGFHTGNFNGWWGRNCRSWRRGETQSIPWVGFSVIFAENGWKERPLVSVTMLILFGHSQFRRWGFPWILGLKECRIMIFLKLSLGIFSFFSTALSCHNGMWNVLKRLRVAR